MASSKVKTLLIYKLLMEYSDEENPLSSTELIQLLAKEGIHCERKSIYADIQTLNDVGFEVISTKSPKKGFFMASRRFEPYFTVLRTAGTIRTIAPAVLPISIHDTEESHKNEYH